MSSFRSAASSSRASSTWSASAAPGCARTTTRLPGGSWDRRSRSRCRNRRFTRLRTTALPTALLTTKPARTGGTSPPDACGSVRLRRCTTRSGRPALRPRRTAAAKSSRRLSRFSVGSTSWTCGQAAQADRRARPLLRRFAMIARPARVRMRSRKPWVFARRRVFGWKVRLLTRGLQRCFVPHGHRGTGCGESTGCHRAPTSSSQRPSVHRFMIVRVHRVILPIGGRRQQPSTLDLVTVRGPAPSGQTSTDGAPAAALRLPDDEPPAARLLHSCTACGQRLERGRSA